MASSFPNGTIFAIGTTLADPKTVSAISNADPAVATSAGHAYEENSIIMLSSGWPALSGAVLRITDPTTGAFTLEGMDTTDEQIYPAGQGAGSARLVSDWVSLSQVNDVQSSGGEQQFYTWQYLEEKTQRQRPTVKNARSMTLTLDYDPDLAWHAALLTADQVGTPFPIRATLPSGNIILFSMYVAYDGEPTFVINENQQVTVSLSFDNPRSRRYSAIVTP